MARKRSAFDYDYSVNLMMLGDSVPGNRLAFRYASGRLPNVDGEMGDFYFKKIDQDGLKVRLYIFKNDEKYLNHMTPTQPGNHLLRIAQGVLLVYDISNMESFEHIRQWVDLVGRHCPKKVNITIVGTDSSLPEEAQIQRVVSTEDGVALANELQIKFHETNLRENTNIDDCFNSLTADIIARFKANPTRHPRMGSDEWYAAGGKDYSGGSHAPFFGCNIA